MIFEELTEVLDPDPHPAALNMAIDEILLRQATGPLLRIYRWTLPSISFGYFGKVSEVERIWPGREWVRRWTGGGMVPHGDDITYTVIAPRKSSFFGLSPLESYVKLHIAIASALASQEAAVELAPATGPKISGACFENAARHDVMAGGKKIAGAAQRRTKHGLLHQGSIQIGGSFGSEEKSAFRLRAANINADLGRALACQVSHRLLLEGELREAADLALGKYGSEEWLRRF